MTDVTEEVLEKQEEKVEVENTLESENKKLKETLMRTLAELDNTRKRAEKEKQDISQFAISKFAESLINVMENFNLAFVNVKEKDVKDKSFFEGIKLTHNELKKVFEKSGLVRVSPLNEDFNPEFHNAIAEIESKEVEKGKVAQVMQAGYTINGRILRPALVAVSKGK
ncbi:MAG: nucleotide exchange factor GrpE [Rickettsiales bacterium]|jgi:molecular chaperone GrpE|nr:nucleotide exchange factor GrpE [Rickettsiales bacterium]